MDSNSGLWTLVLDSVLLSLWTLYSRPGLCTLVLDSVLWTLVLDCGLSSWNLDSRPGLSFNSFTCSLKETLFSSVQMVSFPHFGQR